MERTRRGLGLVQLRPTSFVSPLGPGCGLRFSFTFRGQVKPTSTTDVAATETIKRLGLDHESLSSSDKPQLMQLSAQGVAGPLPLTLRVHASGWKHWNGLRRTMQCLKSFVLCFNRR